VGSWLDTEQRVPAVFTLLWVGGLVYAVAHPSFWQRAHDMAWLAVPLLLILDVFLLRHSRVAWWLFVVLLGSGVVTEVVHLAHQHVSATWLVGAALGLVEFGLLVSPQMRRFVHFGGKLAPSPR